ncbi:uncharacterized protein BJX67DRAFT_379560 [Aspergillus lucknowensis]|uniref:Uncharacterized protein n=1 Tax=Aspergillus lucknowensis TaxID=176173 RepID=A0ABR4LX86_9EURO
MIDPISAASLAYPAAQDLVRLAQKMRLAYKEIRHAKQNLEETIERTERVAQTYELFRDTMKRAKRMKELAPMFEKYQVLLRRVRKEPRRIKNRLINITDIFRPLLGDTTIHPVQKFIAQYEWYRLSKKDIAPLFQEMGVLEVSMTLEDVVGNHGANVLKYLEGKMIIEFRELRKANEELRSQQLATSNQNVMPRDFAIQVLQMLETENPRLSMNKPPSSSTHTSRPSSASPPPEQPSPITPPSSPPLGRGGDGEVMTEPQPEVISRRPSKVRQAGSRQSQPSHPPSPSPPSLPQAPQLIPRADEGENQQGQDKIDVQEEQGLWVPTALFGPPKRGPRPAPGRISPEPLHTSRDRLGEQADRRASRDDYRRRRQGRGRNGSLISVYGNDGEVTATHLTGFAGLPPGWERERRSDQ